MSAPAAAGSAFREHDSGQQPQQPPQAVQPLPQQQQQAIGWTSGRDEAAAAALAASAVRGHGEPGDHQLQRLQAQEQQLAAADLQSGGPPFLPQQLGETSNDQITSQQIMSPADLLLFEAELDAAEQQHEAAALAATMMSTTPAGAGGPAVAAAAAAADEPSGLRGGRQRASALFTLLRGGVEARSSSRTGGGVTAGGVAPVAEPAEPAASAAANNSRLAQQPSMTARFVLANAEAMPATGRARQQPQQQLQKPQQPPQQAQAMNTSASSAGDGGGGGAGTSVVPGRGHGRPPHFGGRLQWTSLEEGLLQQPHYQQQPRPVQRLEHIDANAILQAAEE